MSVSPADKFHGIMWKRLKMALSEDDIVYALNVVSRYVGEFNSEINVINARQSHHISITSSQIVNHSAKQVALMEGQQTTLTEIEQHMTQSLSQMQHVQSVVSSLETKATNMSSLSAEQSSCIAERLASLEEAISQMRLQSQPAPDAHGKQKAAETAGPENAEDESDEVSLSIERLCTLFTDTGSCLASDDAQEILDDLDALVEELATSGTQN
ncbi:hypothetical protein C8035_v001955 [Colletotrichum spinosum]|uniref:Uncharacterized protein n=1 Tax=Colletotrichum spinosum TaxID=1347390 RepID=A0A4R8Q1Z4_9PEZI|nr:hypothetical protein C8035_v001955 [Colletotrichum spinosum]